MNTMKRRLATMLAVAVAFTSAFVFVPNKNAAEVQAASVKSVKLYTDYMTHYDENGHYDYTKGSQIVVEAGANGFYAGDFVTAEVEYSNKALSYKVLSFESNVSYKSNKTGVVSVDKKGKLSPKKTGTAKITTTYKNGNKKGTISFNVKVVSKGKYKLTKTEKSKMDAAYKKISAYVGKKITTSNRFKYAKAAYNYNKLISYDNATEYGVYVVNDVNSIYGGTSKVTNIFLNPKSMRAHATWYYQMWYATDLNPLTTTSAKKYTINKSKSSLNAGTKKGTLVVNRKATADDMYAMLVYNDTFSNKSSATGYIFLQDKKDNKKVYKAKMTATKGSNKLPFVITETITIKENEYGSLTVATKKAENLKKNHTYYVLDFYAFDYNEKTFKVYMDESTIGWTKNITLKAK